MSGEITAFRLSGGRIRLEVTPGPIRVTRGVLDDPDPKCITRGGDLVTFHDTESGRPYSYRITGEESGPEGGWVLMDPVS